MENLNADEDAWVYKGCGFSMNTPAGHDMHYFRAYIWAEVNWWVSVSPEHMGQEMP